MPGSYETGSTLTLQNLNGSNRETKAKYGLGAEHPSQCFTTEISDLERMFVCVVIHQAALDRILVSVPMRNEVPNNLREFCVDTSSKDLAIFALWSEFFLQVLYEIACGCHSLRTLRQKCQRRDNQIPLMNAARHYSRPLQSKGENVTLHAY